MAKAKDDTGLTKLKKKAVSHTHAQKKGGAPKGNTNAVGNDGGAPTKYQDEYAEQAYKLCLLGHTDKELAKFFDVTETTINNWKIEHVEFFESLKKGKDIADGNVADRLFQRAMGFEHDSEEIKVVSDGNGLGSSIERVPIKKIYPPDSTAAIFWLKNRQKEKWRDKIEHGITNKDGEDVIQMYQIPDNGRGKTNKTSEGLPGESS